MIGNTDPLNGKSLKESLKAPALREERKVLERTLRDTPVNSPSFSQLKQKLYQVNKKIQKAQAQDDLLIYQACYNVGFPL